MKLDLIKEWELTTRVSISYERLRRQSRVAVDQHSPSADPAVPKLSLLKWQSGQQLV